MTRTHVLLLQRPKGPARQRADLAPAHVERLGLIELARQSYRASVLAGDERLASPASEDFLAQELAHAEGA